MTNIEFSTKLSPYEEELMGVFWNNPEPMTKNQILDCSNECNWSKKYIHLLLNSLLEKCLIRVVGHVKQDKARARLFQATVDRHTYETKKFRAHFEPMRQGSIEAIMCAFADTRDERSPEFVSRLDAWLKEYRESNGFE